MDEKLLFIYNPNAGKGQIRNHLPYIVETFRDAGYEVTVYPTKESKDAKNIIMTKADRFDYIVCSGGDGTLNEVTEGLMALSKRPPCAYIPSGTVNDFATSLGIPKKIKKAVEVVVNGVLFPYDVGCMNGTCYFTYIAAFGAFTNVSYQTTHTSKNILGKLAYVLEGVKSLPAIKSYHLTISVNGQEIEDDVIFGMVTNSHSVGGFKGYTGKHVNLNDGLFEVVFIKFPKNAIELQGTVNKLLYREFDSKYFYYFQTQKIMVRCEEEVTWTLDGEYGGAYKEVTIQNHEGAIRVMRRKDYLTVAQPQSRK